MEFACFACHTTVAKIGEHGFPEFHDGTSWQGCGDYGSRVLDDDATLQLYVCDVCLLLNHKYVHVRAEERGGEPITPPVLKPWDPGSDATRGEWLRVTRAPSEEFQVHGRLGEGHENDPSSLLLGHGPTVEAAIVSAFAHAEAALAASNEWRSERPAIFTPDGPEAWVPRRNEETWAPYTVPETGPGALGGVMILRVERELGGGGYDVRVRPAGPGSAFDERFAPGVVFKFGHGPGRWLGTGIVQEEKAEDK